MTPETRIAIDNAAHKVNNMSTIVNGREVSEKHAALFKTAMYQGQPVTLVKHHAYGDYWSIRLSNGEGRNAFAHELSEFVL